MTDHRIITNTENRIRENCGISVTYHHPLPHRKRQRLLVLLVRTHITKS